MPAILKFDDPALVATLASQASQYAVDQGNFRNAMQSRDQALQEQEYADRRDRNAALANSLAGRQDQQQQQYPQQRPQFGGTEILPNGAQIHHPAGDGNYGANAPGGYGGQVAGGSRGGAGKFGAILAGGGYVSPLQRQMGSTVDQMEQAGQLDPAEAARWRMIVLAGGNPFEKATNNETIRTQHKSDLLTRYQEQMLGDHNADNARADQEAKDKEQEGDYKRRRQALVDKREGVLKRITAIEKSTPLEKTPDTAGLQRELEGLDSQLEKLPESYSSPQQARPGPTTAPATAPAAATQPAAAGTPSRGVTIDKTRPVQQADVAYLVKKYGSAAKARAAAFAGERAPI
jgi:hypothetical protein